MQRRLTVKDRKRGELARYLWKRCRGPVFSLKIVKDRETGEDASRKKIPGIFRFEESLTVKRFPLGEY